MINWYVMYLRRLSSGFTLIEMLIVFAIIALILAVAIPGFSEFNRGQILKTAAEELKISFREAQSASLSGLKEQCNPAVCPASDTECCDGGTCTDSFTMVGHYITLSVGDLFYSISLRCGITGIVDYPVKNVLFSSGNFVSVKDLVLTKQNGDEIKDKDVVTVMFKPVNKGIGFMDGGSDAVYDISDIDKLDIVLTNGSHDYSVTITSTGDVYETKIN